MPHLFPPPQAPPDGDDIVSAAQTMKLFAARPPSAPAGAPIRPATDPLLLVAVARRRRTASPAARRVTPRRACNASPFTPHDAAAPKRCPAPPQRYGGACSGEMPLLPADAAAACVEVARAASPLRFPSRAVLAAAAGPPGALRPRPGDAAVPVRLLALFRATAWGGATVLRRSATQQQHLAVAFAWPGMP